MHVFIVTTEVQIISIHHWSFTQSLFKILIKYQSVKNEQINFLKINRLIDR